MYTIPNDFNLKKLRDATLQQICYSKNNITLLFDDIGLIVIEGTFILYDNKGNKKKFEVYPTNQDFDLLNLIDCNINEITTNEMRNNLIVAFNNGYILEIIGDEYFESYSVKIGNYEIRI